MLGTYSPYSTLDSRKVDHISSFHSFLPIIDACLFGVVLLLFITLRQNPFVACVWNHALQCILYENKWNKSSLQQYIDNITWCFQYPPWYLAEVPSICPRPNAEGKYGTDLSDFVYNKISPRQTRHTNPGGLHVMTIVLLIHFVDKELHIVYINKCRSLYVDWRHRSPIDHSLYVAKPGEGRNAVCGQKLSIRANTRYWVFALIFARCSVLLYKAENALSGRITV